MKNIFLSASIPLPERHPKYYDTADIIAIRDAVIALASVVLPHHRIIWGGHPSITPLIYYVMERFVINDLLREDRESEFTEEERNIIDSRLKSNIQEHVTLYQSLFFKDNFPPENEKFENVVLTKNGGDIHSSIQIMRQKMLKENAFSAAIFIGGMDGIEVEYNLFKELHPEALILPIASTGAATKIVYDNLLQEDFKNERFLKDYGYMSLFQKLLMDKI
jgi:SLOG cluster3 family